MKVTTKFSIGNTVWLIRQSKKSRFDPCPTCLGEGEVVGADQRGVWCRFCSGSGRVHVEWYDEWDVVGALTIGLVRYEAAYDGKIEESYMAHETGVHSGSVYRIRDLFPTKTKAQMNCDVRNAELRRAVLAAGDHEEAVVIG